MSKECLWQYFLLTYCTGVVQNHTQVLLGKKKALKDLIKQRLREYSLFCSFYHVFLQHFVEECAGKVLVPRMYYHNFDKNITLRYRIVVENWPLKKFVSPSDVGTSHELNTLLNAWQSKATTFRKLEGEEWKRWEDEYHSKESRALARVEEVQSRRVATPAPASQQDDSPAEGSAVNQPPEPTSSLASATAASVQPQTSAGFVNIFGVLGADGKQVQVVSKPRKKRKDAGIRRGRRGQRGRPQNSDEVEEGDGDGA